MHIGLIGGIGPAATEFYYRGMVSAQRDQSAPLALTVAHADLTLLVENLGAGQADAQARIFAAHIEQLRGAGAEAAAVTSIAGHFCIQQLAEISALPLVNALTALRDHLKAIGASRIGLLGSSIAMESKLYGALDEFDCVLPACDDFSAVGNQYMAMAMAQEATDAQQALFFDVGRKMTTDDGADVVLLAGTDLFLAFEGSDPGFAVIDSAAVHIDALSKLANSE